MIPVAELNRIRARFSQLKSRVRIDFFTFLKQGELAVAGRECAHCDDIQAMLEDLAAVSTRIALTIHDVEADIEIAHKLDVDKIPAIVIRGQTNRAVRYFGSPSQRQFAVFIETLLTASAGATELKAETLRLLRKLRTDVSVRVLVTPTCTFSPAMAFNALRFGLQSTRVKVDVIDVTQFPAVLQRVGVPAVPLTIVNDTYATPGVLGESDMAQAILQAAEGEDVSVVSRPKTVTLLARPQRQQQPPGPRRTPGGLILPR
ncbi:MAG TPA: thioredoxin family protein [Dehalococcoidia bacterium]|nr:thioredoxin family protein [Dehalococcoidia bacterium]